VDTATKSRAVHTYKPTFNKTAMLLLLLLLLSYELKSCACFQRTSVTTPLFFTLQNFSRSPCLNVDTAENYSNKEQIWSEL